MEGTFWSISQAPILFEQNPESAQNDLSSGRQDTAHDGQGTVDERDGLLGVDGGTITVVGMDYGAGLGD